MYLSRFKQLLESKMGDVKPLLNEQSKVLKIVRGSFTASNCDEFHAFQGTGGKVVGNMNVIVGDDIKELNKKGYKVKPTIVSINPDASTKTIQWEVTLSESDDGKNWVGFTSRGAGCNNDISRRARSESEGNGINAIRGSINKKIGEVGEIEEIEGYKFIAPNPNENYSFIQVFYRYTLKNQDTTQGGITKQSTTNTESIKIERQNLSGLIYQIIGLQSISINPETIQIKIDAAGNDNNLSIMGGNEKYVKLRLALNTIDDHNSNSFPSKESLENKGYQVLKQGTFQNGFRDWVLLGLPE